MSRGLGTAQHLLLKALASLEAENGEGHHFLVWAIVDRAYDLSPEMQERHRRQSAALEAREEGYRALAAAGDANASLYLALGRSLRRSRPSPRKRRTSPSWITENDFNPSRVLASLDRRGLVLRVPLKGGGSAGLTDAGRLLTSSLSVGTSCADTPATPTAPRS